jgi:hypothetical protein
MRRFARITAAFIGVFTFVAPLGMASQAKTSDVPAFKQKLDKHIEHFETAGRTLVASVLDLAYQYELPIGIERLDREALTRPIDLRFQNESARGILIAIIQQIPEYQVAFSDGLVDIFVPREREDPSNLLNRVIKNFNVMNQDAGAANAELACALAQEIDPSRVCVSSIAKGQLGKQKTKLHMQNARVYEIVNAIVAQKGNAAWTVIVPSSRLTATDSSDLWHIYPLQSPFKETVLDKLSSLKS